MKIGLFKKEIALLGVSALEDKLNDTRRELFTLQLNSSVAHLKNYSHFGKLRGKIARILTLLSQKKANGEQ